MMIKEIRQGGRILKDWLGDGGQPVPVSQAQARADICAKCPHNYKGHWLWSMATSLAIRAQMDLRRVMAISLRDEDELHICEICGCQLKLKVHVPFAHIYRHTADEMFTKYPDFCWQKQDLKQLKNQ